MKSALLCGALAVLALPLATNAPLAAQDNVEGPWGIANGDIFGRARSTQIPMIFSPPNDVISFAWSFNPFSFAATPPVGRSSLVFDAVGNIYFRSGPGNNKLLSVASDGNYRWTALDPSGGAEFIFGTGANAVSPIVGADAVYALGTGGSGPSGEPAIAAFDKDTGEALWVTLLPEVFDDDSQLNPVLHDGKLYVLGETDGIECDLYQIDAATGAIDWQSPLPIGLGFQGTMTLLPDAFGPGLHGLYFNGDGNFGPLDLPEVYGIEIDPDPASGGATLEWAVNGGKVARSHVIASPDAPGGPRLYTHTWGDYGGHLYSFDPVTGTSIENSNSAGSGHGFYDVGCLGFDDASVIAGGFSGQVITYTDDGSGSTTDTVYQYSDLSGLGPSDWFGEYRAYGQLLEDAAGNAILVTGTNSRVNDLGSAYTARVVVLDITNGVTVEDGPLYVDDIAILEGPDPASVTAVFEEDFEGLLPGDLGGQNGWEDDLLPPAGNAGPVQVADDPTGSGQGLVAAFDAEGSSGGWQGAFRNFPDTTESAVVIRYRQHRADLSDNLWPYFGDLVGDFSEGWTLAWDITGAYFPYHFLGTASSVVAQERGIWQLVTFTYENLNDPDPQNRTVTLSIDGTTGIPVSQLPTEPTEAIRGFGIQLEGTGMTAGGNPGLPIVEWDTGIASDNAFTVHAGPLAGPDGRIYYFDGDTGELIALEPESPPPLEFARGDVNADGTFNVADAVYLLSALFIPGAPGAPCAESADTNDDDGVNIADAVYLLSALFVPGSPPPPPPPPPCRPPPPPTKGRRR
ncbi:MAG: hypothetical protein ACE5GW_06535, partial [Planctomycetota bacterium]